MRQASWRRYLRFFGEDTKRDLDDELQYHLESRYEEFLAAGMNQADARAAAERRFGDVEQVRARCEEIDRQWERERAMSDTLRDAITDIRIALRQLRRAPALAIAAVLCFALGIGANTSIFSVVNAVLFRPLPFREPDRLVVIGDGLPKIAPTLGRISTPEFLDYRTLEGPGKTFEKVAIFDNSNFSLSGSGTPERVQGLRVSSSLFSTLGVKAAHGRTFASDEERVGAPTVVVLTDALWRRRYGADPAIVGRPIHIDGGTATVVGIMPASFVWPLPGLQAGQAELYVPWQLGQTILDARGDLFDTHLIGRLSPGVTMEQANSAVMSVARSLPHKYPDHYRSATSDITAEATPLREELVGNVRTSLLVLLAAVGFVLLIACINVSSLLVARATARRREIAVRTAMGATRGRLVQQFLAESAVLVVLGTALGVLLAMWGARTLATLAPDGLLTGYDVSLDWRVLVVTVAISLLCAIAFSLFPALQRTDMNAGLRDEARGASASRARQRTRRSLVVSEIALAFILAVGAGLMIRSFVTVQKIDPGFDASNLLGFRASVPSYRYARPDQVIDFERRAMTRVRRIPGVRDVSMTTNTPMGGTWQITFVIEGKTSEKLPVAWNTIVMPRYFETMRIPLRSGRSFTEADAGESPSVAIINEALAKQFFPGENPIGKRLKWGGSASSPRPWSTIVGVAGDVRQAALDDTPKPAMYFPVLQQDTMLVDRMLRSMSYVVRTDVPPSKVFNAVRDAVRELDAQLPLVGLGALDEQVARSVASRRFYALLFGAFATLALALAAVGIYGLMAFTVVQRTREIGIRLAIGAAPSEVLQLVVKQGLALAIGGVAIGFVGALLITRLMRSLLFGVGPLDATTFFAVPLVLVGVTVLATYLPARRASRIDPQAAIRLE